MHSVNAYNSSFELLSKDLKSYKKRKYRVILMCSSRTRAERMAEDLRQEELNAFFTTDTDRAVQPGEVMVLYGKLKRGFEYPDIKFVVLTETDIFGGEKKKRQKKKKIYEGEHIPVSYTHLGYHGRDRGVSGGGTCVDKRAEK